MRFKPLGDAAVRIEMGDAIDPRVNREIRTYGLRLERAAIPGVVEWVPSYAAVTVFYQPHRIRYDALCRALEEVAASTPEAETPTPDVVTLPVLYGGDVGPDLEFVAKHAGLAAEEVVALHSRPDFLIYMIGFAPGFPFLGGMPERLATPRLDSPRRSVPAGSVGIGGAQTGVYPIETPGGWRIIGRTPVPLFTPRQARPILLEPGGYLRFRPVTPEQYAEAESAVNQGSYTVDRRPYVKG